ncbi:cupin domain-containing protein [Yinghuangia aomiensis]
MALGELDADPELTNGINGPDSGYIFMALELPPDEVMLPLYKAGQIPGHDANGFHQTQTVDLVVVVEGQLVSVQEDGEVVLNPGDVLVQRGTNHTWRNPGDKPNKFMAVLVNDRERPSQA